MIPSNGANEMTMVIACCGKKHLLNLQEVVRLEAKSNYTLIYLIKERPILVAKVLSFYEAELQGAGFMRVHRSHLVNKHYIRSVTKKGMIVLYNEEKVLLPRRKKKILYSQLQGSMREKIAL